MCLVQKRGLRYIRLFFLTLLFATLLLLIFYFSEAARAYSPDGTVSFAFDDGQKNVYTLARPILAAKGLPATFFIETAPLNAGETWVVNWSQLKELQDSYGWEVGSHSVNHPYLTKTSDQTLDYELKKSREDLESHGLKVKAFATPYGDYDLRIVSYIAKYYESHRAAWGGFNAFPYNDYELTVLEVSNTTPPSQVKLWIDDAKLNGKWLILLFHSIVSGKPGPYEYNAQDFENIVNIVSQSGLKASTVSPNLALNSGNILKNGSFEDLTSGWANNWFRSSATSVTIDSGTHGSYPTPGKSLKIKGASLSQMAYSDIVAIDPTKTHLVKLYENIQDYKAGGVGLYVDEFDQNGFWISGQMLGGMYANFVGTRSFVYVPTVNTRKISVQIFTDPNSSLTLFADSMSVTELSQTPAQNDTTPPKDPIVTSPSHISSVWSTDNTIDVTWSGASDDLSGVDGYSYDWDPSPSHVPDTIKDAEESGTFATSFPLPDGDSWYFHLRTVDNAGNWSATVHLGPFLIDTALPANPTVASSSHALSKWSNDNTVDVSWPALGQAGGAADLQSGVDGYSVEWSTSGSTIPDNLIDLQENQTAITSPPLANGNSWYFHLITVDNTGNWAQAVHLGPFFIDANSPTVPANLLASAVSASQVNLSWTASSDSGGSGVAGYKIERSADSTNFTEIATTAATSYSDTGLAPSTTFRYRLRSFDGAGNTSGYSNVASATTFSPPDTTPPTDPIVTSPSHTLSQWSTDNTIDISWFGAQDASGIDGYSFDWNVDSNHLPDKIKDVEENVNSTTSPQLSDGDGWYFHLRTADNAGNWSATVHLGPFHIKSSQPDTLIASGPSGTINTGAATFTWSGSDAFASALTYSSILDGKDSSWSPWASSTSKTYSNLSDGDYTFRVRAKDIAGNEDPTAAQQSFTVFIPPPSPPSPQPGPDPEPNPTPVPPVFEDPVVKRLWGMTSADTAIAISREGWPDNSSKAVVVARDDYFTDALGGGPLAHKMGEVYQNPAPILLTSTHRLYPQTKQEIQRLGAEKVYLLGGEGAIGSAVESQLELTPGVNSVERIWGRTAYGTASAIKDKMSSISSSENSSAPTTAVITTGENFPDAMVISGPAAKKNMPILLVEPSASEPPAATKRALQGITQTIIVGGPGAVHPELERWLNDNGYAVIERFWGPTEYETAIDVVSRGDSIFDFDESTAFITRGDYFTDALAGGAFASRLSAPIVLVRPDSIPEITRLWLESFRGNSSANGILKVYILGGSGAVSNDVLIETQEIVF